MIGLFAAILFALVPVPPLTGPVVDQAGVLSPREVQALSDLARRARAAEGGEGPQLGFLLVPTLEGEPIEDFSIRVAEAWKLGSADKDNGLLFVVAVQDRRMRIEVGGGLEGEITDAQSARIVREVLAPAFRQGQYGAGLLAAANRALSYAGVEIGGVRPAPQRGEERGIPVVALLFLAMILLARALGGRRRRSFWTGGGFGPGGFGGIGGGFGGGGFGGGGGWRGGGGGFSGGGASGSW